VIEPDQLPPPDMAEAIRDATRDVLNATHYRDAAQRLQKEIEGLPGLDQVVTLLERLAAERAPLPAEPAVD
ncbi:MAG: hypothetical protein ACJ78Q_13770, partial [Chloroflexia bacterium]